MAIKTPLIILASAAAVLGQQPGSQKKNDHPSLPMQSCTGNQQCTTEQTSITLDANWMWVHTKGSYQNCYDGNKWDTKICPDPATCAANCALDGGDYEDTYGVSTDGDAVSLKFVTKNQNGANVGSRLFLLDGSDDSKYRMFKLKNREFTFDVDVSQLPCGLNGALYFVEMDDDGGMQKYPGNKAGAKYGTGYCDAQCPHDIKFIDGAANTIGWNPSSTDGNSGTGKFGTCCTEMDIWESNSAAWAVTPHTCDGQGQTQCSGITCGDDSANQRDDGMCDKDGADWNPYRLGDKGFFGAGANFTVDSTKKMTVVTSFHTTDGTDSGDLSEITRTFVQDGVVLKTRPIMVGGTQFASVTDKFAATQKKAYGDNNTFATHGGLKSMGEALDRGVVLVMSLWADYAVQMLWLDSTYPPTKPTNGPGVARGPCSTTSGNPKDLINNDPNSQVVYSNIKTGTIGSTYPSGPSPPPPPPSPPAPGGNNCADPGSSPACNTCSACCHGYIPAGAPCDTCVKEKC